MASKFQPTRPVRGVTLLTPVSNVGHKFQPTRPVRGVTFTLLLHSMSPLFQPTRPVRGVTIEVFIIIKNFTSFNPHAPCGA